MQGDRRAHVAQVVQGVGKIGAATAGPDAISDHPTVHLGFLTLDGKRIAAEIHFETAGSLLYYNAGVDPDAKHLSPGVVQLERLVRRAIDRGKCRLASRRLTRIAGGYKLSRFCRAKA